MKKPSRDCIHIENGEAAYIILADPVRYAGLPLMWAQLWAGRHGSPMEPRVKREPTVEERLAAHEERQRVKKIERRRDRWKRRKWRLSQKGNSFTKVNGFHIVVFGRSDSWAIGISDQGNGMKFLDKRYSTREEAMLGAFDAVLYMESKRFVASPAFVEKANEEGVTDGRYEARPDR